VVREKGKQGETEEDRKEERAWVLVGRGRREEDESEREDRKEERAEEGTVKQCRLMREEWDFRWALSPREGEEVRDAAVTRDEKDQGCQIEENMYIFCSSDFSRVLNGGILYK
jgi:hypothetical protein